MRESGLGWASSGAPAALVTVITPPGCQISSGATAFSTSVSPSSMKMTLCPGRVSGRFACKLSREMPHWSRASCIGLVAMLLIRLSGARALGVEKKESGCGCTKLARTD